MQNYDQERTAQAKKQELQLPRPKRKENVEERLRVSKKKAAGLVSFKLVAGNRGKRAAPPLGLCGNRPRG